MTRARDVANIDGVLTTKGDIYAATAAATPARLGVGSNGDTLVADSSTSTGLRYTGLFGANKNKIINGDFYINQRGFTSSTASGFNFDRWQAFLSGGTSTISNEAFTPGTAPVAGYEGKSYLRMASTGQSGVGDRTSVFQYIEDCRTLAGQTVTISFWAKASTGTPNVSVEFFRSYGTGGSPSSSESVAAAKIGITSSWVRYSATVSVPSLTGKTLGTTEQGFLGLGLWTSAGTNFNARTSSLGIQSVTIDWWGLQVEAGSVATPFQTATGTIQGELSAAQRYYHRSTAGTAYGWFPAWAGTTSTTAFNLTYTLPVQMRVAPTSIEYGGALRLNAANDAGVSITSLTFASVTTPIMGASTGVSATATTNTFYRIQANNDANAYIGWSAEL